MDTNNQTDEQMMRDALKRIAATLREEKLRGAAATAYAIAIAALSRLSTKPTQGGTNG